MVSKDKLTLLEFARENKQYFNKNKLSEEFLEDFTIVV